AALDNALLHDNHAFLQEDYVGRFIGDVLAADQTDHEIVISQRRDLLYAIAEEAKGVSVALQSIEHQLILHRRQLGEHRALLGQA
ncbi:hypothetical protein J5N93_00130, partial [Pseudomonas aeruginosa]|uniref:hypothetical protein n=1 Tax=Pseudomonas aeruginosa TaxID=287 RepID=UPI001ABB1E14|nr:hypothetical protein [Pseudomonas aeruginosa]